MADFSSSRDQALRGLAQRSLEGLPCYWYIDSASVREQDLNLGSIAPWCFELIGLLERELLALGQANAIGMAYVTLDESDCAVDRPKLLEFLGDSAIDSVHLYALDSGNPLFDISGETYFLEMRLPSDDGLTVLFRSFRHAREVENNLPFANGLYLRNRPARGRAPPAH